MLNIIKAIVSFFTMTILGMMGGQGKIGGKSTRRFGIPIVAWLTALGFKGFRVKDLCLLLLIPILCLGYGPNSHLFNWLGQIEWLTRLVYASLVSLPFLFYGRINWIVSVVLLIIAFQIETGSLGYIAWFGDILLEDILRYGALSIVIIGNILFKGE